MKKCPYCAEEIQDAAIKCRYCGSMLAADPGVAAPPPPGVAPATAAPLTDGDVAPPHPMPGTVHHSSSLAIGIILILLGGVGTLLYVARQRTTDLAPVAATPATTAATLAPSQPAAGDYEFLGLPWNASRGEVRSSLSARGFTSLGRDEDGDDQYQGRVDGRDAGIAAMFAGDRLAKVMVVMLAADQSNSAFEAARQALAIAYGTSTRPHGQAIVWPERNGSLVWLTTEADGHVKVNYESAQWPAESKRRKDSKPR